MKKLQHIVAHDTGQLSSLGSNLGAPLNDKLVYQRYGGLRLKAPGFAETLPFRFKTADEHHCNHLNQKGECYGT